MTMPRLIFRAFLALALLPFGFSAHAQTADAKPSDCHLLSTHTEREECASTHGETKTIYLENVRDQNEANELTVAIRNAVDPGMRIYLDVSQNALVITTYPEQFARIEAIVHSLDRPHKTYRVTYTITELDGGKAIGVQHFSMVAIEGQPSSMKEGDKIPVATGTYSNGAATTSPSSEVQTQFTYLDIGMNFDSVVSEVANGAYLRTKVEQSSLGQPSTIAGITEPVVRQTVFQGTTLLTFGKPVMLGTIDVPNSTRHFDIAAELEQVK